MAYIGVVPLLATVSQKVDENPELADFIIQQLAASEDKNAQKVAEILTIRRSQAAEAVRKAAQVAAMTPSPETLANTELVRNTIEYNSGVEARKAARQRQGVLTDTFYTDRAVREGGLEEVRRRTAEKTEALRRRIVEAPWIEAGKEIDAKAVREGGLEEVRRRTAEKTEALRTRVEMQRAFEPIPGVVNDPYRVPSSAELKSQAEAQAKALRLQLYHEGLKKYNGNADKARAYVAREAKKMPGLLLDTKTPTARGVTGPSLASSTQAAEQAAQAVGVVKSGKLAGATLGVGSAQAAKIAGEEVVEKAAAGAAPVVGQAATAAAGAAPVVGQAATAAEGAATQAPKAANAGFWSGLTKMPLVGGALKALPYLGLALTAKEFLIDPVLEERKRNRTANAEALLRMRDNAEGVQYEQEQLALTQTLQKLMAQSRADEMRQVGQQVKLDFLVSPEEQKLIAQAGVPYMPSPWEYYGGGVSR